jgi:hypothetical protein
MKQEERKSPGEPLNVTAAGMEKSFAGPAHADFKFAGIVCKTMPGG